MEDNNIIGSEVDTSVSETQKLINDCKIDLSEKLAPPPVAMQIKNSDEWITLFTKGNFSIVTGPAKSRKTYLISMLIAAAVKGVFKELFQCNSEGVNLIFDTEQSRYKTQQIAKRICILSETKIPDNLCAYSLRSLDPSQRIALIEKVLENTQNINFVAIDGIIDLEIDPILQAEQAQRIVSKLMKWTELYNIHIVCVLHYNKTAPTLLGHLGSFAHRKADAIISVTKSKEDPNISLVEPVDCREKEFSSFAFSIDDSGQPYILENYSFEKKAKEKRELAKPKPKSVTPADFTTSEHTDILQNVFKIQKEPGYSELYRSIKSAVEKISEKPIGDNKAKDFVTFYIQDESIIKTEFVGKKSIYTLKGQADLNL